MRKMIKSEKILVAIIGFFLLMSLWAYLCYDGKSKTSPKDKYLDQRIEIRVGQTTRYNQYGYIRYLGMNSDKTFAVGTGGSNSFPVFYPISTKELTYYTCLFEVVEATPYKLILINRGYKE